MSCKIIPGNFWFGHMERLENDRMTKMVYGSEVDGYRRRGRPKVRWKDTVREHMEEGGVDWDDGVAVSGDRGAWRNFCCGHPRNP